MSLRLVSADWHSVGGGGWALHSRRPFYLTRKKKKSLLWTWKYPFPRLYGLHSRPSEEVQRQDKTEEVTETTWTSGCAIIPAINHLFRPSPPFLQLKLSTCRKEGAKHSRASRSLAMKEGGGGRGRGRGVNRHILARCCRGQATRARYPLSPSRFNHLFFSFFFKQKYKEQFICIEHILSICCCNIPMDVIIPFF